MSKSCLASMNGWVSVKESERQSLSLQLYRASALFETIRHEAQLSTDYKLSLFDLQTSSYQALQRVLVSLGESSRCVCVRVHTSLCPHCSVRKGMIGYSFVYSAKIGKAVDASASELLVTSVNAHLACLMGCHGRRLMSSV